MTDLSIRLGGIIDFLCRAIAARAGRNRAIAPLVLLLWGRLRRTARRFDSLIKRIRAGQLPPTPRDPATRAPRQPPPNPPLRLPGGFGWLGQLVPEARIFGSQLQHLLTDPEMKALLASDPRVGRLLRPLCRMLGVDPGPNGVPPPPAGRRTRAAVPAPPPPDRPPAAPPGPAAVPNRFEREGAPYVGMSSMLRKRYKIPALCPLGKPPSRRRGFS